MYKLRIPRTDPVRIIQLFQTPSFPFRDDIYKDYVAPVFRHVDDRFYTDPATFGMVPRERIPPGVKVFDTMNARAETVGESAVSAARGPGSNSL